MESPARTPEQKARDANRKPAEVLALSGVKPGDRVVEFASFGQYFTTLVSDIVGEKGMVYMYDLPYTEARAGAASRAFVAAHPNARYELVDYNDVDAAAEHRRRVQRALLPRPAAEQDRHRGAEHEDLQVR